MLSLSGAADLSRQESINSIADNFGMCSWRPDSETVASRAFAQTVAEKNFKVLMRLTFCQLGRVN